MAFLINMETEEMKRGYYDGGKGSLVCAVCGQEFTLGEIFRLDGRLFDAREAVRRHCAAEHGDPLGVLCGYDKKRTGLTENQCGLLSMMRAGMSDAQIAKKTGCASSTVRSQRFMFRERAKQARLYLAIYELACEGRADHNGKGKDEEELMEFPEGVKMTDARFESTTMEERKVLAAFLHSSEPLRLRGLPSRDKKKVVILKRVAREFEMSRRYTEGEVNGILSAVYEDFATLRRDLIDYGFMDRERDCSAYWIR